MKITLLIIPISASRGKQIKLFTIRMFHIPVSLVFINIKIHWLTFAGERLSDPIVLSCYGPYLLTQYPQKHYFCNPFKMREILYVSDSEYQG